MFKCIIIIDYLFLILLISFFKSPTKRRKEEENLSFFLSYNINYKRANSEREEKSE